MDTESLILYNLPARMEGGRSGCNETDNNGEKPDRRIFSYPLSLFDVRHYRQTQWEE
jgi:hypothetical protein